MGANHQGGRQLRGLIDISIESNISHGGMPLFRRAIYPEMMTSVATRIRNPKDFWTGIIFMAFGGAAVIFGREYPFGTTFKMGPGYFPTVLGALLALVGLITSLRGLLRSGTAVGAFAYREMFLVLAATVLFGLLLRAAGLIVAVMLLVVVSAYASRYFRWGIAMALGVGMSAFCVLVFVKALGLPIPMFGPWFGQ
jgi:hypothetical protein